MTDITKLQYWGADEKVAEDDPAPAGKLRFPCKPELNKPELNKHVVLVGAEDVLKLQCDVIVVATNDTCDAEDCIHADLVRACGPEFKKATKNLAPIKVTETHILPSPEGTIGARFVAPAHARSLSLLRLRDHSSMMLS